MRITLFKRSLASLGTIGCAVRAGAEEITPTAVEHAVSGTPMMAVIVLAACTSVGVFALLFVMCRRHARARELQHSMLQDFSVRLMHSQEEERKRISRELHDSLGQDLLLIKTSADLALAGPINESTVRRRLERIQSLAAEAVRDVRTITNNLRPPELDRLGLAAAVEAMAEKVAENSEVRLEFAVDNLDQQLVKKEEINLYRVIQEALTNVLKHARANHVQIRAARSNGDLKVLIEDDGCGFDADVTPKANRRIGMGLPGLAERARSFGGTVQVDSVVGAGTRVNIQIPITRRESEPSG